MVEIVDRHWGRRRVETGLVLSMFSDWGRRDGPRTNQGRELDIPIEFEKSHIFSLPEENSWIDFDSDVA